ncbi:hypothetical protein ACSSS7_000456 [Eimeria intestinalis]
MAASAAADSQLGESNNSSEIFGGKEEEGANVSPAASSSLSSRVSGVAGGWGRWLISSASSLVNDVAAETVEAKNDLKEFCSLIAADSAAWVRRQTTGHGNAISVDGRSRSPKDTVPSSRVCMQEENNNDTLELEMLAPSNASKAAAESEAKAGKTKEKNKQEQLPFWRADPLLHQRFSLMVKDESNFLSDVATACDYSIPAFPSDEEIAEYLNDSDVSSTFARLVPSKVDEQLFWKRLHARVCLLRRGEKQVSVHHKTTHLSIKTEGQESSESEEDISWEDLGREEEVGSHEKTTKTPQT